jgi:hypothetical protein
VAVEEWSPDDLVESRDITFPPGSLSAGAPGSRVQQVGIIFTPGTEFAYAVCHELGSSPVVCWAVLTAAEERPIMPLELGMRFKVQGCMGYPSILETFGGSAGTNR